MIKKIRLRKPHFETKKEDFMEEKTNLPMKSKIAFFKIGAKEKRVILFSLATIILLLATIVGFLFFLVWLPTKKIIGQAKEIENKAREVKSVLASKDLKLIEEKLSETDGKLESLKQDFAKLSFLKVLPRISDYYRDGERVIEAGKAGLKAAQIITKAMKPYQDFLGFKSATDSANLFEEGTTTEERINFLVESIEGLKPKLDEIEAEIGKIEDNFSQINPERYPLEFRGVKIREKLITAQGHIGEANRFLKQGRPLIEKADWLLGKKEPRKYLFLFQNDGELRPTGGFWTAYGIINVDKGKFSPAISEDIYSLDAKFDSTIPAPRPIKEYHKNVYYWYLRDMNLSPNFKVSVEEFLSYYRKIKGASRFDGVVAVDTQFLVDVIKVLGRIGVPGWGNFTPDPDSRCWGCPQVVYQLELLADKPVSTFRESRKGFLAPLMHSIIANTLGSPKEKVTELANVVFGDFKKKHILLYFPEENLQKGIEGLGVAGTIDEAKEDYLHLNNANFAGAKSNLFIETEVKQEFEFKEDGTISKKVTAVFKNDAPASDCNLERGNLCLNGLYRDWFRFYVPKGSKLIKMMGSEVEPVIYEEMGKTVFEGFYGDKYPLYPKSSTRISIEYELPFKSSGKPISELIQKQPGTKIEKYQVWVNGNKQEEFDFSSDRLLTVYP